VAHDITADRSPVTHRADADRIRNFRVPRANLKGLYGSGPVGSPYMYAQDDPAKLLLVGPGQRRAPQSRGDRAHRGSRNDVHLFTSQMAVAFIKLHNRLVDRLREDETAENALFEQARRATTWHYQHVIVREFLPSLIGAQLTTELFGPRPSCTASTAIPTSRSSSPTPPTATVTPRAGTVTRSTRASARCRCFPTSWASAR
jgi:hypothetical protein